MRPLRTASLLIMCALVTAGCLRSEIEVYADLAGAATAMEQQDEPDSPAELEVRTEPNESPTTAQLVVGGAGLAVLVGIVLVLWGATRPYRATDRDRSGRRRRAKFPGPTVTISGWEPPRGAPTQQDPDPAARPEPLPPLVQTAPAAPTRLPPQAGAAPDDPFASNHEAARAVGSQPDVAVDASAEPAVPTEVLPAEGWYSDPATPGGERWFDGSRWSNKVR